jgi:hypothetical protein
MPSTPLRKLALLRKSLRASQLQVIERSEQVDAQAEAAAIPIPFCEELEHFELPDPVLADTPLAGERSIPLSLLCPGVDSESRVARPE